jgi:hypothetical protein
MRITFAIKESFFDRPKIVAALGRARSRALSKAGSFVRRRARSSMRRRKQSSAPGQPPTARAANGPSLKTILFAFDGGKDSVIVGPVQLNQATNAIKARTTVPALHEFGETASLTESRVMPRIGQPGPWRLATRRRTRPNANRRTESRTRTAKYPARPFMAPALAAEAPKFPDLFGNSIK